MSGQHGQSTPRTKTSPKQGPLRATMPISSVTKEGSNLRSKTPTNSPPRSSHSSMDNHWGRRSPGAAPYKGASTKNSNKDIPTMRRTASLDTIYLRGLFPVRDEGVFWHRDRATQTDISTISNSLDSLQALVSTEIVEDKLARLSVRQRRRSSSRESNTNSDHGDQTASASSQTRNSPKSPLSISAPPKSSRSSEEGLNQEIESYIPKSEQELKASERLKQPTPEGRKAPVADLLREPAYTRSFPHCNQNNSSALPFRDSISPIPAHLDANHSETEDSQSSSPDHDQERMTSGSSPHINRFSSRAPPDGCERVLSKSVPILRPIPLEVKRSQPHVVFTLKPSSHSAFETLQKDLKASSEESKEEKGNDRDSPIVPDQ